MLYGERERVAGGKTMTVEIAGRDQFKFFKRPVVGNLTATADGGHNNSAPAIGARGISRPVLHQPVQLEWGPPGGSVGHASAKKPRTLNPLKPLESRVNDGTGGVGTEVAEGVREMACQTDYRDNDCQTDPYTPAYTVPEGEKPDVLALLDLKWKAGLPAGQAEIAMIDRIQRRKDVEANLPQGNTDAAVGERLRQLESLEKAEWEEREDHIKQLQETRLRQIEDAVQRREAQREEASAARIEALKRTKIEEVERQLLKLQEKRLVATRKLTAKHANPCSEKSTRDIVRAHATYGTAGKVTKTNALVEPTSASNYDVRPTLLSFPEGVQELERSKAPQLETIKESKLQPPQDKAIAMLATNFQKRQARQVHDDLEYASRVIEDSKKEKQAQQSVQELYRATPRLQRPDTPTLMLQGDEEEEREEGMLLLQRLLRGRAVQNDFFEGKERCHGLIEELQAASNAKGHEEWWLPEKEREDFAAKQEEAAQAVLDEAQGDVVHGTLDYLFKELLRQQEAAKIDRLRAKAEATRARREEEETMRRQAERELRERNEYQYAKVMEATDAGIEGFLDDVLHTTARRTAHSQAVREQAQGPREVQPLDTVQQREEYVCGLLDHLILPLISERNAAERAERRSAVHETAAAVVSEALGVC